MQRCKVDELGNEQIREGEPPEGTEVFNDPLHYYEHSEIRSVMSPTEILDAVRGKKSQ